MMAAHASERVRVRRKPDRGRYDRAVVDAILDATPLCHVAFVSHGHPNVIPTMQARHGDVVHLHASSGGRLAGVAARGPVPVSLAVTLTDGIVLARSGFHHSMNYRSVVALGSAVLVVDDAERRAALDRVTDAVAPGRSMEIREPTARELAATAVLRLPLDEVSAKVRTGGPNDEPADLDLDVWAGVVPLSTTAGGPEPADDLRGEQPVPRSVEQLRQRWA